MRDIGKWEDPYKEYPPMNPFLNFLSFLYYVHYRYLPEWHRRRIEIGAGLKEIEDYANRS